MQNQIKKIRFLTLMAMAFFMGVAFAIDVSASPSSGENNEAPPQSRLHRPGQGGAQEPGQNPSAPPAAEVPAPDPCNSKDIKQAIVDCGANVQSCYRRYPTGQGVAVSGRGARRRAVPVDCQKNLTTCLDGRAIKGCAKPKPGAMPFSEEGCRNCGRGCCYKSAKAPNAINMAISCITGTCGQSCANMPGIPGMCHFAGSYINSGGRKGR